MHESSDSEESHGDGDERGPPVRDCEDYRCGPASERLTDGERVVADAECLTTPVDEDSR